jgi:acetyl-CoA synthetase
VTTTKPGSATRSFPGIAAEIRRQDGAAVEVGGGLLALTKPWPGMLRGIYGDRERFKQTYFSQWPDGVYFTGDGARRDEDAFYWLLGRVDDVLNVAGHRIGTMEVESALVDHPAVAEAAVVGRAHEIKGQAITAFVILKSGIERSERLIDELRQHVAKKIGAIARPEDVLIAADQGQPGRTSDRERIVCKLTGVAVQEIFVCDYVLRAFGVVARDPLMAGVAMGAAS